MQRVYISAWHMISTQYSDTCFYMQITSQRIDMWGINAVYQGHFIRWDIIFSQHIIFSQSKSSQMQIHQKSWTQHTGEAYGTVSWCLVTIHTYFRLPHFEHMLRPGKAYWMDHWFLCTFWSCLCTLITQV